MPGLVRIGIGFFGAHHTMIIRRNPAPKNSIGNYLGRGVFGIYVLGFRGSGDVGSRLGILVGEGLLGFESLLVCLVVFWVFSQGKTRFSLHVRRISYCFPRFSLRQSLFFWVFPSENSVFLTSCMDSCRFRRFT